MTPQQIFDKVAAHLIAQGRPARDVFNSCKYRLPTFDGRVLMCAIGALIPDDKYDPAMEGLDVYGLLSSFGDVVPEYFHDQRPLLDALQQAHDDNADLGHWRDLTPVLDGVARDFGLQPYRPVVAA